MAHKILETAFVIFFLTTLFIGLNKKANEMPFVVVATGVFLWILSGTTIITTIFYLIWS